MSRFQTEGGSNRHYESLWWKSGRYVEVQIETADESLVIEKLELIEGVVVEKMTQNSPHVITIYRAPRALEKVFEEARFMVRVQ